jgi:ribosomal protein S12 methylthiotransferase accessory factor
MTDIEITFPGGRRVDAQVGRHILRTDQPIEGGGQDSAAAPFDLFLASLGTCAGLYVLAFCQARGLSTEGLAIHQRHQTDASGHLERVELEISLPAGFPEKYRAALVHAAEGCKVKRTLARPPEVAVSTGEVAAGTRSATAAA